MVVWNGETFYYKTLGIQPSEIIDTTAAGDSFCGGLIFIFSLYDSLRHRFITKLLFFRRCHLETSSFLTLCFIPMVLEGRTFLIGIWTYKNLVKSQDILHEAVECGHYCAREIIKRRGCSLSTRCGYFSWKNGRADLTRRSLG